MSSRWWIQFQVGKFELYIGPIGVVGVWVGIPIGSIWSLSVGLVELVGGRCPPSFLLGLDFPSCIHPLLRVS